MFREQRKLDVDEAHMKKIMARYTQQAVPYMMLLFPEGTDLSPYNMKLSDEFAEKTGVPKLKYTLHPRTKGFWICMDALRGSVDEVWDVTLAYNGRIAQDEAAMVSHRKPVVPGAHAPSPWIFLDCGLHHRSS